MSSSNENHTVPTDIEFVAAIRDYLDGHISAGVRIAEAVTEIGCTDGVVTVIFDPHKTRMSVQLFHEIKAFENLAQFVGTPFAFNDDDGQWFRKRLVRVETSLANGSPLGTLTAAELHALATGEYDPKKHTVNPKGEPSWPQSQRRETTTETTPNRLSTGPHGRCSPTEKACPRRKVDHDPLASARTTADAAHSAETDVLRSDYENFASVAGTGHGRDADRAADR